MAIFNETLRLFPAVSIFAFKSLVVWHLIRLLLSTESLPRIRVLLPPISTTRNALYQLLRTSELGCPSLGYIIIVRFPIYLAMPYYPYGKSQLVIGMIPMPSDLAMPFCLSILVVNFFLKLYDRWNLQVLEHALAERLSILSVNLRGKRMGTYNTVLYLYTLYYRRTREIGGECRKTYENGICLENRGSGVHDRRNYAP